MLIEKDLKPKPPPPVQTPDHARPPKDPTVRPSPPRRSPPAPPPPGRADRVFDGLKNLQRNPLKTLDDAFDKVAGAPRPGRTTGPSFASVGLPSLPGMGGPAVAIGSGDNGLGIGRSGFSAAGRMGVGRTGRGSPLGRVYRADSGRVRGPGVGGPTIDRQKIAEVINSHIPEIQRCYESALMKHHGLHGTATLEWVIDTGGLVRSARTKSSSLQSSAVEGCILSSLKLWRFPPARGGEVTVSYPFVFDAVGF